MSSIERKTIVTIESPYRSSDPNLFERNLAYARAALRDSLLRGESPFISHLLYTQDGVLNDNILQERDMGIWAGIALKRVADKTVVYKDFGISSGMQLGIDAALRIGQTVEYRELPGFLKKLEHYASEDSVVGSLLKAVR